MTEVNNYITIFFLILDIRFELIAIMANKKYKIRNRKRKFHGKPYTTTVTYQFTAAHNLTQTVNNDEINCSTSKRKLKHTSETTRLAETECTSFFFFSCILSNYSKLLKNMLAANIVELAYSCHTMK